MENKNTNIAAFLELTPERLLQSIEAAYPVRCTGRVLALNSMENRVFEVEIENDNAKTPAERFVIAKFYRPGRWSKEQLLEEHQFLNDLVEHELPVVAPIAGKDGKTTLYFDQETHIFYTVFPKCAGRTTYELNDEDLRVVGRLLARVHGVGKARNAPSRVQINVDTYARSNLQFLLEQGKIPENLVTAYQEVVLQICNYCESWFAKVKSHRIHGDCHLGNILQRDGQFYLVDFDDMLSGPAVQDLWLLVPSDPEEKKSKLDILLRSYETMQSFDYESLRLIEPLRALRYIHFSAWLARRWEDPIFPRNFPFFASPQYWQNQLQDLREQCERIVVQ